MQGNHDGHESLVCVQDIYENGILCTQGRFFLFEELSGIEVTHEWLAAAGAEHLTEGAIAAHHGVYYIPAFPFTFYCTSMWLFCTGTKPLAVFVSCMNCNIFM